MNSTTLFYKPQPFVLCCAMMKCQIRVPSNGSMLMSSRQVSPAILLLYSAPGYPPPASLPLQYFSIRFEDRHRFERVNSRRLAVCTMPSKFK